MEYTRIVFLLLALSSAEAGRKLTPCETERVKMDKLLESNSQQINIQQEIIETQKRIISDLQSANYALKLTSKDSK